MDLAELIEETVRALAGAVSDAGADVEVDAATRPDRPAPAAAVPVAA